MENRNTYKEWEYTQEMRIETESEDKYKVEIYMERKYKIYIKKK